MQSAKRLAQGIPPERDPASAFFEDAKLPKAAIVSDELMRSGRAQGLASVGAAWHMMGMTRVPDLCLTSRSPAMTAGLAQRLGAELGAGDVILLSGPVGAGKSHFARALIQSRLQALGRHEEVPSPTFTIVQTYDLDGLELWHADLYRLGNARDCDELGLLDAFESAICLVEWPDRLGAEQPSGALHLTFEPAGDNRTLHFVTDSATWKARLDKLAVT